MFIIRNKENLELMLNKLKHLKTRVATISKIGINTQFLELKNMITVANLITKAAFTRKESRGTHYRTDYPKTDDKNWLKHILLEKKAEKIEIFYS